MAVEPVSLTIECDVCHRVVTFTGESLDSTIDDVVQEVRDAGWTINLGIKKCEKH